MEPLRQLSAYYIGDLHIAPDKRGYPHNVFFFLFLHENICCGDWLEGASNEYPQRMFLWRNKKIITVLGPSAHLFIAQSKEQLHRSTPWQF